MSGTPTIIPNVTRSRASWRTSFIATARRRRSEAASLLTAIPVHPCGDDEHVFEAGVGRLDLRADTVLFEHAAQLIAGVRRAAIGEHAQAHAELRDAVHPGQGAQQLRRLAAVRA